mmetsp:Transcript_31246/g.72873  ORF Transcript_31246/g.72873 Transcript_31246/m.72873 type:complete len:211 (-) Transcript_31246:13-645(-)
MDLSPSSTTVAPGSKPDRKPSARRLLSNSTAAQSLPPVFAAAGAGAAAGASSLGFGAAAPARGRKLVASMLTVAFVARTTHLNCPPCSCAKILTTCPASSCSPCTAACAPRCSHAPSVSALLSSPSASIFGAWRLSAFTLIDSPEEMTSHRHLPVVESLALIVTACPLSSGRALSPVTCAVPPMRSHPKGSAIASYATYCMLAQQQSTRP